MIYLIPGYQSLITGNKLDPGDNSCIFSPARCVLPWRCVEDVKPVVEGVDVAVVVVGCGG